jgi:adenine deaminase
MLAPGAGSHGDEPIICVALDPAMQSFSRAAIHGLPGRLEGIASTLTPQRLLVGLGSDPTAIARCVDTVTELGGGIAYQQNGVIECLALPVGGVITDAPFADVVSFWEAAASLFAALGHQLPDPLSTLLYIGSSSLPGARFTARGLVDTRRGTLIEPARPLA